MAIRVAINGFGRIGRPLFRVLAERKGKFEVVAVNDLADAKSLAILLKYDTAYGRFPGEVTSDGKNIIVDGKKIPVLGVRSPKDLPWADLKVDVAVESTGVFRTREDAKKGGYGDHLKAGAKKVLLSAPAKDKVDATIVLGVNDDQVKPEHTCYSNASCTTNCLAPVAQTLLDNFGIVRGLMTTCHAYTNDQHVADLIHSDLRRARAAAQNIIPTTTGAAKAVGKVIPALNGKLNGLALRVPVLIGSVVDLVVDLEKDVTVEQVNAALKKAAEGKLKGIMDYTEDPIVSSDIIGTTVSSTVDGASTIVLDKRMLKIIAWYDNEWGFSNRMADLMALMMKA